MANPKSVSKFGWDVIHVAAETGNKSLVKMLLDRDVDVDTLTQTGETPLHIALNRGNVSIAELLFESGADPTIQNCKGMSALHLLSGYRTNQHIIRRDFFFCWITLPADLKKWAFKKRKEKEFCLTSSQNCLFWCGQKSQRIIILKYYSASLNYIK